MRTNTFVQPDQQLGLELATLIADERPFARIVFVSAFTALRTVLRLREGLLAAAEAGAALRLTVGIDLGGTSRDVLEELLRWNCEVFVYHNPITRSTFHPKVYLFERDSDATLFIGSNNLTDGGMFTNYEAATRHDFSLPEDERDYQRLLQPLIRFLEPTGPTALPLNAPLIETLTARGLLTTETEARRSRRAQRREQEAANPDAPANPFLPVAVPMPPLLPRNIRAEQEPEPENEEPAAEVSPPAEQPRPTGILVWSKRIQRTDALEVREGSHHVGGVRLTQAAFESPPGHIIDQTTYFRRLFDDYDWETEPGRHRDQEHAFVPMRIIIRGVDYGIRNFEISHKPSGEAGQANYTTILRWGRNFNDVIEREHLTGTLFSLYETTGADAGFLIEITEP